jgi:UV DNA damage endonuclease
VIKNALRDLDYHAEMLSLLKLPPQEDRDAVMILHMGGVFGDKEATLNRFRDSYKTLPQGVKNLYMSYSRYARNSTFLWF